ncbi:MULTISPECIES: DUF1190 family protein [Methylotuvimicrobium]|uniref:Uncharacterized protein n=1 Tax=Methylotuvimicrobium alcaliphilum (strain DSM 19304 / NCIMB 14124 / VKM B-2133 / 20Z) TaxID=1091494 RepID=G4T0P0_META2|nr:DUF1190 family protein [Methylotuvimicrobium alcaliphilum]MBU2569620.1 DUF1190 family protein [Gammaproteobacteria bacterium]CCE22320.1 conserved exported protein of unknown function [Methylotuvimicrobium alcaliphilum 20Z]
MKRTKSINLDRMKKNGPRFWLKPVALAVAGVMLNACSDEERDARVYTSLDVCKSENPQYAADCEAAYRKAQEEAAKTAPKYASRQDCESEFGLNRCTTYPHASGQNWFMPAMAGFMFARALDFNRGYQSQPVFTSYRRSSPFYNNWVTADGRSYGSNRSTNVTVGSDAFQSKPPVTRTISRGGFGSTVAAKSSWSGSSSTRSSSRSSGWGG